MAEEKIITSFQLDTTNIKQKGENRSFVVRGSAGAVFSLFITKEDSPKKYYNFDTQLFETGSRGLDNITLNSGVYRGHIRFPKITDDDHYDVYLVANLAYNTKHTSYQEVRYEDGTIDLNSSTGSDSAVLMKKIYQYTDLTLTLDALSPNALTAFGSVAITSDTITVPRGKFVGKKKFTIIATAAAARAFSIIRQPTENDFVTYVERTIGSAAIQITGEDVSASRYYKWPIDNIVGLANGMFIKGNNIYAGTKIADYQTTVEETITKEQVFTEKSESKGGAIAGYGTLSDSKTTTTTTTTKLPPIVTKQDSILVSELGVQSTGQVTITNGIATAQPGNIVFDRQQVAGLADDTIKIYGYGPRDIRNLTNYDIKLSNLKVELTPPTTTTTEATSAHVEIAVADREGVINNVSRVSGIGIDDSVARSTDTVDGAIAHNTRVVMDNNVADKMKVGDRVTGTGIPDSLTVIVTELNPDNDNAKEFSVSQTITVADGVTLTFTPHALPIITSGGGADGAGDWTLCTAQSFENGITLTVLNTSRVATITGEIEVVKGGIADVSLRFDLEKILTAV